MTQNIIKFGIYTPYFCHPSETFIIDSTRLDPKSFETSILCHKISPFASENLSKKINRKVFPATKKEWEIATDNLDVIHIHHLNNLRNIPKLILERKKVYVTCHGEDVFRWGRDFIYRWQITRKSKYVSKFLCVSQNLALELQKCFKIPSQQIEITPLGINLSKYPFNPFHAFHKPLRMGIAARLVDYKGVDDFIRVCHLLKLKGISLQALIIGQGTDGPKLKRLAKKFDLTKEISWEGWLRQDELIRKLKTLDIYLAPYKTSKNGAQDSMTMILKEVMALGIPVVSTTNSAIPELINSQKNGLLTSPGSPTELVKSIEALASSNAFRKRIVLNARKHIETHFDLAQQSKRWLKIIKKKLISD